ncbi:MAG TPA: SDR family oxidoreductase [Steroidobacteraceae bacterium]|nr:SDR family oxidoreductase [Steroidobacteraceae bacterium]
MRTVLITGSNRGIGLGLASAYAAKGWRVIATCRDPAAASDLNALAIAHPNLVVKQLDVTDADQVRLLAVAIEGRAIDVLINNSGIAGNIEDQQVGKMDLNEFERVLAVNTVGPLRVAEALLPNIVAGTERKIVNISTSEASFGVDRGPGRIPFYRASKAGLNMLMLNYAKLLAKDGIAVALINPGPVDTDMMKGARMPLRSVELAVSELIAVVDQVNIENTGRFWNYDGKTLPW